MWQVTVDGHRILLGAHIDDFVLACTDRPTLDAFRIRLLEAFECTYKGPLEHYFGCEVVRDMVAGLPLSFLWVLNVKTSTLSMGESDRA